MIEPIKNYGEICLESDDFKDLNRADSGPYFFGDYILIFYYHNKFAYDCSIICTDIEYSATMMAIRQKQ